MNLAQRSNYVQAHNLRCQGLTYRQIGEKMGCAHSTAAHYVREFEKRRAEIIESLAADTLVHAVSAIQTAQNTQTDQPELHARHINSARELRLLLNSLDQIEDRRQRRERRIHEQNVRDSQQHFDDIEEIARIMIESGQWDPTDDIDEWIEPVFGPNETSRQESQTSPSGGGAPQGRRGPATATPIPYNPTQTLSNPAQQPSNSAHNRTKSNRAEQKSAKRPPVQAPPRPKREKNRPESQKPRRQEIPRPAPRPSVDDFYEPPFDPKKLIPLDPSDPRVRKLFGNR